MFSPRSDSSAMKLRPSRALLHPLWLGSLALLVLNDHVLKGASLVPDAFTGKLSDFAGLVVAPLLLAALLSVRTRRGWARCHVAVGAGFSAIQLSAFAAEQWSATMAAIGFPWFITRDATDLIALPALALSFWVLRGAMQTPIESSARRSAELVAAGTGLLCCAATSPAVTEPEPFPPPDLWTDVYVHNGGEAPLVVRMRPLADEIEIDCNAVADDPGRLLTEPLFGESRSFLLAPDQNFGLRLNNEWEEDWEGGTGGGQDDFRGGCAAYLLDIDGLPPAVVLWDGGDVPTHNVPGEGYEDAPRGGIDLVPSDNPDQFGGYEELGDDVLFVIPPATPPVDGACAPQSDASRLEWSEVPLGTWELVAVDRGADGCFALDLGVRDVDGELFDESRWYFCAPLTALELDPGRLVQVSNIPGSGIGDGGVKITTADDEAEGLPLVEIWAFRGETFPQFRGLSVAAIPEFECGFVVGERCGTVTRSTSVTAGGGSYGVVELEPGASQTLTGESGSMTVTVAHAEERGALDWQCAEGPDQLGIDLEVVALYTEPVAG